MWIIDEFSTILENVGEEYAVFNLDNHLDVFDIYFCNIYHLNCIFIVYDYISSMNFCV